MIKEKINNSGKPFYLCLDRLLTDRKEPISFGIKLNEIINAINYFYNDLFSE